LKSNEEMQYDASMALIETRLSRANRSTLSQLELSWILKPPFETVVSIIHKNHEALGEEADEFTETLCFETCFKILEMKGISDVLLDLLLVSKYIAGEAAVAYSMSGVVDVLDKEHRIQRIAAAYLGGLIYVMMLDLKQDQKTP
jgi:hypothetical protein